MELILFALISLIAIVAMLASRLTDNSFPFPFDSKQAIYTPAEKNFISLVEKALGPEFRVLNRVSLADIVDIRKGVSKKAMQSALNNANNKYLDFVICQRDNMKLLGAVDLVDTKGRGYKVKKDWFVSGALEAASIPHVRVKVKPNYSVEEIRACLGSKILGVNQKSLPKVKGRVIPAPLVKARPKNTGAITATAAKEVAEQQPQLSAPSMAALPH
ncbi:DUF2726 domain-containing protein [Thalassotalea sp. M1531]|uniref:DUF2726 domain-containing protein n=1 Tax=Thalassotalea algicola TaxID=2716224 RepID=A0A7Y0L9C7_9GAMM|nr:DUF2726 domain-containing protein [Thalassotalea algicola]NMP30345.1 DUF2726 domain-containing protein [Thalassotalea algicola]